MGDSPGGDAGGFSDLPGWDTGADRGSHRSVSGIASLPLGIDCSCQRSSRVRDLAELLPLVSCRGPGIHLLHRGRPG